jgi:hypothetical protein
LFVRYIDLHSVKEQVDLLHAQEKITAKFQPEMTSEERKRAEGLSFFTFDDLYYYWELVSLLSSQLYISKFEAILHHLTPATYFFFLV